MKEKALKLLRQAIGDPDAEFRDGQWECIEALLQNRRMLVVQRTEKSVGLTPGAGSLQPQSKSINSSSRTTTGSPCSSGLSKYSPRQPENSTGSVGAGGSIGVGVMAAAAAVVAVTGREG